MKNWKGVKTRVRVFDKAWVQHQSKEEKVNNNRKEELWVL
jgi:hypothetical protein